MIKLFGKTLKNPPIKGRRIVRGMAEDRHFVFNIQVWQVLAYVRGAFMIKVKNLI
jgi:hypothetical protein